MDSSSYSGLSSSRQNSPSSLIPSDIEMDDFDSTDGRHRTVKHTSSQRHSDPNKSADILRLKRKFLKDQKKRNQHFATMEIKRQKLREVAVERRRAAKDRKVNKPLLVVYFL